MADLSTLLPLVLPWAPGAGSLSGVAALRSAAIEFFAETLAWQETLAPIATVSGADKATIIPPDGAVFHKLLSCTADGGRVNVLTPAALLALRLTGSGDTVCSVATRDGAVLMLWPTPGATVQQLLIEAALRPSESAVTLPDAMLTQYGRHLAFGARASLRDQPGKPYSDPVASVKDRTAFEDAINTVRGRVFRGMARTSPRTTPVYF